MIQAISTSTAVNTNPSLRANPAILQAQLQKYEKTLAECVSCASAKTAEGKKNIEDITRNIDNVKARLSHLSQESTQNNTEALPTRSIANLPLGQHINIFA